MASAVLLFWSSCSWRSPKSFVARARGVRRREARALWRLSAVRLQSLLCGMPSGGHVGGYFRARFTKKNRCGVLRPIFWVVGASLVSAPAEAGSCRCRATQCHGGVGRLGPSPQWCLVACSLIASTVRPSSTVSMAEGGRTDRSVLGFLRIVIFYFG